MALCLEILVQLREAICLFSTTARKVSGRGLSTLKAYSHPCCNTLTIDINLKNHCSLLREEPGRAVTTKTRHSFPVLTKGFDRIQSREIQTHKTDLNEITFQQES